MKRKTCSKCKKSKGRQQFSKNASNVDGYDHYCKACNSKRMHKYFSTRKGKAAMDRATRRRKRR
ncbi:MAG: hypothetical protein A2Z88_09130 [Omnitrophica WOR_2 bacterium GWA2_47_8]|nr:MAG: hypothetical protein A2Z88_09130 [Omnitrophica WOR_2 bacterium GWA2_47_8]